MSAFPAPTGHTPDLARFGPDDLPDLTGSRAVVTGANNGIGFRTALALADHGAEVVLACRNEEAARAAAAKMPGRTRVERLDLASLESVQDFAARVESPVDLLVDNAGVMRPPRYRETEDGFELQFGTNHLGHFALTGLLLRALLQAEAPRVVVVASIAHHGGDESVLEGNPESSYRPAKSYSNSKLANLLFFRELHRRAGQARSGLTVTAAHPGVAATNLVTSPDGMGANAVLHRFGRYVLPLLFQSSAAGANPSLWAATYAEPGSYVGPQGGIAGYPEARGRLGPARLSRHARNDDLARALWSRSEELTGVVYDFTG